MLPVSIIFRVFKRPPFQLVSCIQHRSNLLQFVFVQPYCLILEGAYIKRFKHLWLLTNSPHSRGCQTWNTISLDSSEVNSVTVTPSTAWNNMFWKIHHFEFEIKVFAGPAIRPVTTTWLFWSSRLPLLPLARAACPTIGTVLAGRYFVLFYRGARTLLCTPVLLQRRICSYVIVGFWIGPDRDVSTLSVAPSQDLFISNLLRLGHRYHWKNYADGHEGNKSHQLTCDKTTVDEMRPSPREQLDLAGGGFNKSALWQAVTLLVTSVCFHAPSLDRL